MLIHQITNSRSQTLLKACMSVTDVTLQITTMPETIKGRQTLYRQWIGAVKQFTPIHRLLRLRSRDPRAVNNLVLSHFSVHLPFLRSRTQILQRLHAPARQVHPSRHIPTSLPRKAAISTTRSVAGSAMRGG